MKYLISIGLILLSLHLFGIHSKLLFHTNPDGFDNNAAFSFLNLSENTYTSMAFSLVYSIMTIIVIRIFLLKSTEILSKFVVLIIVGLLDGFGIFLYYAHTEIEKYFIVASIYYSAYTFFIIVSLGFHNISKAKSSEIDSKSDIYKQIKDLKKTGKTQKEIAQILHTNESKISRILNK